MIYAKDVPVSGSWRCGIDVDQTGLAEKVRNLLQSQLAEYSLGIETSPSGRIVVAKKCGPYSRDQSNKSINASTHDSSALAHAHTHRVQDHMIMIGTRRSFRDGDTIGPASALFFTSLDKLQAFLARDGHGALRDFAGCC